jgi:hypothetical protein
MRTLYILAALCLAVAACTPQHRIDWGSIDYGLDRRADSHREETHK